MAIYQEAGYAGQLYSLGGVLGTLGRGRQSETVLVSISSAAVVQLLSGNVKRVSAMIYNGSGMNITLSLGDIAQQTIYLANGSTLQIDPDFPWTGLVYASGDSAVAGNVRVTEVSVP